MTLYRTMSAAAVIASAFVASSAFAGGLAVKNKSGSCVRVQNRSDNVTLAPGQDWYKLTDRNKWILTKYTSTNCTASVEFRQVIDAAQGKQIAIHYVY